MVEPLFRGQGPGSNPNSSDYRSWSSLGTSVILSLYGCIWTMQQTQPLPPRPTPLYHLMPPQDWESTSPSGSLTVPCWPRGNKGKTAGSCGMGHPATARRLGSCTVKSDREETQIMVGALSGNICMVVVQVCIGIATVSK